MIYTQKIQDAIHFSIKVHEEPVKQKRKGKDIPYVTHPLTVGLILSQAGAGEDVVVAGILHDTIEDCEPYGSVTKEMLADKFGEKVAELVDSVSEKDKGLSWHDRKEAALKEIGQFSQDSLLVKSGDVLSNNSELYDDFKRDGIDTFKRFNASAGESVVHAAKVVDVIKKAWPENPLINDLNEASTNLAVMYNVIRNEAIQKNGEVVTEVIFTPNREQDPKEVSKEEFKEQFMKYATAGSGYDEEYWNHFYEDKDNLVFKFQPPEHKNQNRMFIVKDGNEVRMFLVTVESEESFFDAPGPIK